MSEQKDIDNLYSEAHRVIKCIKYHVIWKVTLTLWLVAVSSYCVNHRNHRAEERHDGRLPAAGVVIKKNPGNHKSKGEEHPDLNKTIHQEVA